MIKLDNNHLLMIEPRKDKAMEPINDNLADKMIILLYRAKKQYPTRGFHQCICGAISDNCEHVLPNGIITNSLAAHYLQWHRDEIPQSEIDKLLKI